MNYLILCLTILLLIIIIYKFKTYFFYNLPYDKLILHNYTFQDLKNHKNICILRDNSVSSSSYVYEPEKKECIMTDNFHAFCLADIQGEVLFSYKNNKFTNMFCSSIFILNDKRVKKLTLSYKEKTLVYDVEREKGTRIVNDISDECDKCTLSAMEYYDRPFVQAHDSRGELLYGLLLNKSNQICFHILN